MPKRGIIHQIFEVNMYNKSTSSFIATVSSLSAQHIYILAAATVAFII
jgi:hypothetical protein